MTAMLIFFASLGSLSGCASRQQVQAKREAEDQEILRGYLEEFKPGATRTEVESRLRERRISFFRSGEMKPHQRWFDKSGNWIRDPGIFYDVIKIRSEQVAWLCGAEIVYLAIRFEPSDPHATTAQGTDAVVEVSIIHQSADCP